ncbi:hypothetical protein EMIHUDRAFT_109601 [Emiliania huxleyi CCMP1516]|uniref:Uncharacterized protein n=2 Tax=Emiliania huxleyi TaxID=2903 RepID=A0A0D3KPX0_EMIH1|nr:hypothetical protein EMIHUDRAFT_109601 [Emiliania huxleyi CCMP1516]EOD37805.1 hypothetical protein EMIHUDRAFT_109601 [Emiliania huxleyi CCMP1516]|eukprot:XP_005790234.1 hypothetical protein EMIHUDRAFT_109601 [Emiliania huxleyi CCMP1516]
MPSDSSVAVEWATLLSLWRERQRALASHAAESLKLPALPLPNGGGDTAGDTAGTAAAGGSVQHLYAADPQHLALDVQDAATAAGDRARTFHARLARLDAGIAVLGAAAAAAATAAAAAGDEGADAWVESDATGACAARPYVSLAARKRLRVLDGAPSAADLSLAPSLLFGRTALDCARFLADEALQRGEEEATGEGEGEAMRGGEGEAIRRGEEQIAAVEAARHALRWAAGAGGGEGDMGRYGEIWGDVRGAGGGERGGEGGGEGGGGGEEEAEEEAEGGEEGQTAGGGGKRPRERAMLFVGRPFLSLCLPDLSWHFLQAMLLVGRPVALRGGAGRRVGAAGLVDQRSFGAAALQAQSGELRRGVYRTFGPTSVSGKPTGCVVDVALSSPRGTGLRLAVGSGEGPHEALLYDLRTEACRVLGSGAGQPHATTGGAGAGAGGGAAGAEGEGGGVGAVEFEPEGAEEEEEEVPAWAYVCEEAGHTDHVLCLCTHARVEGLAASGGKDNALVLWDVRHRIELGRNPLDLAFGHGPCDGSLLAAMDSLPGEEGQALVIDAETHQLRLALSASTVGPGCAGHVSCLHASLSGGTLLTGAADGSVRQYCARDGSLVLQYNSGMRDVNLTSLSRTCSTRAGPTGRRTVLRREAAAPAKTCPRHVRDMSHRPLHVLRHEPVAQHVNGVTAQWAHSAGTVMVRLWDVSLAQPMLTSLPGHSAPISCLAIAPDDDLVVSGGDEGKVVAYSRHSAPSVLHMQSGRWTLGRDQDNFLSQRGVLPAAAGAGHG